jgi:ABC-type Mn2+/Zn2+ transport system ATPase subunit
VDQQQQRTACGKQYKLAANEFPSAQVQTYPSSYIIAVGRNHQLAGLDDCWSLLITSLKMISLSLILIFLGEMILVNGFTPARFVISAESRLSSPAILFGKKAKRKGATGGGGGKGGGGRGQLPQEKKSVQDDRFDAMTRQFMFTMVGLSKILPDKSKTILKNINLSFYPGAKIGLVGLNGSGKSTLLRIMAGVDKEFEGTARPLPGASIGYLPQEPELPYETVQQCIDEAVADSRSIIESYNNLGLKLADPGVSQEEIDKTMADMEKLNNQIEAGNLWDLDRIVSRAMDALRVPAGDSKTAVLSGGEKRRVALCRLLLQNHDMLLLDEPTNHLDCDSIAWLEQFLADFKGTVICISKFYRFILTSGRSAKILSLLPNSPRQIFP